MNGEFVERVSQTNTRNKSIADQNWVMSQLTSEERYDIKMQCISTRHKEEVQHWNPITGKIYNLDRLRDNPSRMSEKGIIYAYDTIKLKNAIKNIIKKRYTIKSKQTPKEYFESEQSSENDKYFEMLAEKTIQVACKNEPSVARFFEGEYNTYICVLIHEQEIDTCLASLLVPDIEIERTKERENR